MEESLPLPDAEGNIFDQFDVKGEHLPGGASIVGYICRLTPCHGEERLFDNRRALMMHRRQAHSLPYTGNNKIPEKDQICQWLRSGKPRPYEIPQRSPELTTGATRPSLLGNLLHCKPDTESELQPASLESNIFEQFDVRHEPGEVGKSPSVAYFCLLSQCHEEKVCLNTYAKWMRHRRNVHKETEEVQCVNLPDVYEIREWVTLNKPRPYGVPVRGRTRKKVKLCPVDPAANTSTEFHNRKGEVSSTPSNVGNEVRGQNSHHQELPKLLSLEGRPSLRGSKSLARLGKLRPSTPPDEIPRESHRPGRRPRNADADGCSSDTERAHQKKKKRQSIRRTKRSQSIDSTDSDSSDLVVLRVVLSGEDPSGGSRKQFMEKTNPAGDETPPSNDSDEEFDDGTEDVEEESDNRSRSEDVDDLSVDRTVEDPNHDHNSADMEEFGEEPREDPAPPEDALPSLPYSEPELHDSGAAGVAEVDEDDHEEFESPDNVLPPQPELQNVQVVGHSSVQPRDFQGVTDEHQKNSNAEMVDADEETPKDSIARENVLPSLQNSTAEMGEVEEEEPEDFVSPENALTSFTYSQPHYWGHSSVETQDFQGDVLETLPNPTAEMDEVEEEAPEVSVAIENVLSSRSCSEPEFGVTAIVEHDNVPPQELPGDIYALLPNITEMAEFGEVHEENINPWNLNSSVQSDLSEQIASSPLWHLDGDTFQCLPQDFPGGNWPNPSEEDNLKYYAVMAEFGEEAPEGFVATENLAPRIPLMQSEGTKVPSFKGPINIQAAPVQENVPLVYMNQVFANAAGMAEVGEEAPEGFVATENLAPWIPLTQSEGIELSSLIEGPIDIQAAFIQQSVPRVHMDPVFINGAGMSKFGEEALEEFAAPGNLMPLHTSNAPQETSEQLYVSRLNTNASLQDPRNIQDGPIIHEDPRTTEFINTDIAFMNEQAVVTPSAPSTQPEGREIGSIFIGGRAGNSRENQVDPFQEFNSLMHVGRDFEPESGLPLIDYDVLNPEEFFRRQAVALLPQQMQHLFSSRNSEASNNFPDVPFTVTDPLIDMNAGLDYELRMRLQTVEIPAGLLKHH